MTVAADSLCHQIQHLRRSERNENRKDSRGIIIRPDKLLKGVVRADRLVDELCMAAIHEECAHLRRSELKNSYVVKGHGQGRGT